MLRQRSEQLLEVRQTERLGSILSDLKRFWKRKTERRKRKELNTRKRKSKPKYTRQKIEEEEGIRIGTFSKEIENKRKRPEGFC